MLTASPVRVLWMCFNAGKPEKNYEWLWRKKTSILRKHFPYAFLIIRIELVIVLYSNCVNIHSFLTFAFFAGNKNISDWEEVNESDLLSCEESRKFSQHKIPTSVNDLRIIVAFLKDKNTGGSSKFIIGGAVKNFGWSIWIEYMNITIH